jgi:hypothetical protein
LIITQTDNTLIYIGFYTSPALQVPRKIRKRLRIIVPISASGILKPGYGKLTVVCRTHGNRLSHDQTEKETGNDCSTLVNGHAVFPKIFWHAESLNGPACLKGHVPYVRRRHFAPVVRRRQKP